jgi:hypothetical protein
MITTPFAADQNVRTYDVFISYRRLEASYSAGWLHDYFSSRLGHDRVFLDIDAIRPGVEFWSVIRAAIADAKVMLVLIGPRWATYPDGTSRLADPADPVRIEVEAAFARDLLVIPLLLDGASLPAPTQLPPSLARLRGLNAVSIDRDMFRERLDDLLRVIANVLPAATQMPPPDDAPPDPGRSKRANAGRRDAEQRSRLLTKLLQLYGDYLRQAVHDDRVLQIPLHLRPRPELVRRPADVLLPLGRPVDDRGTSEGSLLNLLDETGGMEGDGLLVLGGAGAGKSTALVELAVELLHRAVEDPDHPVPVYLPLRQWGTRRLPIATWVVQELVELYEVPDSLAERWTSGRQLLFLLDGLDELPRREQRAACVAGINRFQRFGREFRLPLVVTARRYEYATLPQPLELENAVEILPLSPDLVERRLADSGVMHGVLDAIHDDPDLRPMLASPLLLSMITRTFADGGTGPVVGDDRAEGLFTGYVEERFALERRARGGTSNAYPPDATTRWLSALAATMTRQQQVVFLLGRLSTDWLPRRAARWVVDALPGLLIGIACLVPWGLFGGSYAGLRACLILVLAAAVTVPMLEELRSPAPPTWTWSWRAAWARLPGSMVTTVSVSAVLAVVDGAAALDSIGASGGLALDTASFLERLAAVGVAVVALSGGVRRAGPISSRRVGQRPARRWALCVGVTFALCGGVARTITAGPAAGLLLALTWMLLSGIGAWLVGTSGPAERVSWSLRRALRSKMPTLSGIVAGGLAFVGYGLYAGPRTGLEAALTFAVCTAAVTALIAGLERAGIPVYVTPNEATWRSFRSGMLVGVGAFVVLGGVAGGLVLLIAHDPDVGELALSVAVAFGFQLALVIAMTYGLGSALQHWLLRILLWQTRVLPLRLGKFLDYAVSLKLLYRSGGGGYTFVHGLLQDHFTRGHSSAGRVESARREPHGD